MGLCKVTFSRVVVVVFVCFLAYYCYLIYHIFNPPQCSKEQPRRCLNPAYSRDKVLELWVYSSPKASFSGNIQNLELLLHKSNFLRSDDFKQEINVSLPGSTLKNGSLYVHMFLGLKGNSPHYHSNRQRMAAVTSPVTRYAIPESTTFSLLMGEYENSTLDERPVTHWIPWLDIHSLADDWKFDRYNLPAEVMKILHILPGTPQYLPILYVDQLKVMKKHLKPISSENVSMPLEISYSPVGIGQLRLWLLFGEAMENMRKLGFSEKEFDDVKGIFLDSSLWLLGLTVLVSFFHLLFDFLAFKNDIGFWRGRKTMVGLSTRTMIWRTFSHTVVFLFLLDEKTSLLVSIPMGIATIIEFWKLGKAFKVRVVWSGWLPKIERGGRLKVEQETESYDSEAMRYLSYLLIPLVTAGAVYQLLYSSYKSWYSWIIHCLVNGVYAFGFLFMLPQLFLNYKLKSVAHLPWRAFMYKGFNTFIDDVFAFIIVMPTSHRLAVFRDDLVFMVYLYQRWLYPVDRSRVNEYGESFEEIKEHKD